VRIKINGNEYWITLEEEVAETDPVHRRCFFGNTVLDSNSSLVSRVGDTDHLNDNHWSGGEDVSVEEYGQNLRSVRGSDDGNHEVSERKIVEEAHIPTIPKIDT